MATELEKRKSQEATVIRDMDLLHPRSRVAFKALEANMVTLWRKGECPVLFKAFETYRHPFRQELLRARGTTRASAYMSPHQYGLAVDFVPWIDGKGWTWEPPNADICWAMLRSEADKLGFQQEIKWDRPHVESRLWAEMAQHLVHWVTQRP